MSDNSWRSYVTGGGGAVSAPTIPDSPEAAELRSNGFSEEEIQQFLQEEKL